MATVNKDFRIKAGLVVEGANATVNGEDIITTGSSTDNLQEGSTNVYFTDGRAKDSAASLLTNATLTNITITGTGNGGLTITAENGVAGSDTDDLAEGTSNLYFTNQRALDATALAYDSAGAAANAQTNAETFTTNAINALDTDDIEEGLSNLYFTSQRALDATSAAYDGAGSAAGAQTNAETYAKNYADSLASNYDATGSATTAENNAKAYTDNLIGDPTVNGTTGNTVKARIDSAVAGLVDSAPALLDTLNELAAAIADNPNYATDMATSLSGKQDTLTAGTGIDITSNTVSVDTTIATKTYVDNAVSTGVGNITSDDVPEGTTNLYFTNQRALDATASAYDAAGDAANAYTNATIAAQGYANTALQNAQQYTNESIASGDANVTPRYQAINLGWYRKEEGSYLSLSTGQTGTAHSFDQGSYGTAKYLVRIFAGTHSQATEILVTHDTSNNIAYLEYGTIYTSESELVSIAATNDGSTTNLVVTNNSGTGIEIMTAVTLLAKWD